MKTKTWLPIAVALVLGVFAAVLAKKGMSAGKAASPAAMKVIVAARVIAPGVTIAGSDLETKAVAPEALPAGAFTDASLVVGRTTQAAVGKGKAVLASQLAPEGSAAGLQALVPSGMRAMTIEVNEFSSVGGMITPGARVDIIGTMQDPRANESMSRTIAQNVIVKAVGQDMSHLNERGEEQKVAKHVTLIVTPKQAEAIQLSSISGRPWLVLRGGNDNSIASLAGTTLAELRGAAPSMARDFLNALMNVRAMRVQQAMGPKASEGPSTQPVVSQPANWAAPRSVHTIRATVESTVSVAPTSVAAPLQHEVVSGEPIEP